jgi:hypothetical protein
LVEASKYPEAVYRVEGRGDEGKIATMALKQLDPRLFIATTLSIPYSLTPIQPVKALSPFQKPKEAQKTNVRIVAVPENLANLVLDIQKDEHGVDVNPIEDVNIPEDKYYLYVKSIDSLDTFPVSLEDLYKYIDLSAKKFAPGTLTPEEQEELLSTKNFTQRGAGGKQITLTDDQVIHILTKMYDVAPYNIIFENPDEIIQLYQDNRTQLSKVTNLIKRILSKYLQNSLANKYPDTFGERDLGGIKAVLTKSGVKYNAIVPLSAEPIMKFKSDKIKQVADEK